MALLAQQIDAVGQVLLTVTAPGTTGGSAVARLRADFPGLALSQCDASDVRGETPFLQAGAYDLFLVATDHHCWRLVGDPQQASGVLIAPHP